MEGVLLDGLYLGFDSSTQLSEQRIMMTVDSLFLHNAET